jgi:hypothetical protein
VTDDFLITLQYGGYLLNGSDGVVCTAIKTGNPRPFQEAVSDQV